jgi:hypothetical protein
MDWPNLIVLVLGVLGISVMVASMPWSENKD